MIYEDLFLLNFVIVVWKSSCSCKFWVRTSSLIMTSNYVLCHTIYQVITKSYKSREKTFNSHKTWNSGIVSKTCFYCISDLRPFSRKHVDFGEQDGNHFCIFCKQNLRFMHHWHLIPMNYYVPRQKEWIQTECQQIILSYFNSHSATNLTFLLVL